MIHLSFQYDGIMLIRVLSNSYSKPQTVLLALGLSRKDNNKLVTLFCSVFLIFVWFHLLEGSLRLLFATMQVSSKSRK